jgi:transcriptional regulator with XRE-family HTH domain
MSILSAYLIVKRGTLNLSQAETALRAGITKSMMSRMEAGLAIPTLTTVDKLARVFGLSSGEMLTEMERPICDECKGTGTITTVCPSCGGKGHVNKEANHEE